MKQTITTIFILLNFVSIAQTIKVWPYLQNVTSNSAYIMWETSAESESIVEWGLTEALGNSTSGNTIPSLDGASQVHEVFLSGLLPDVKYYYRVKSNILVSPIYRFRTNPSLNSEGSFNFVALSDTQFDGSNPNKLHEICHDGILNYFNKKYGGNLEDNLGLILVAGDLVNSGNTYSEWEKYYFTPSKDIFHFIQSYPIAGNHEENSKNFFNYFHLPENGPAGYTEHTWYKDYSNVRFIGMDSNLATTDQLDWLKNILIATEQNQNIDFVVLELHHPYKSELWTPGELYYTGQVITVLENFSNSSGKPSFHLFGHTHAYSRGQSKNAKHIWMNVATGSGNIDYWGEFDNEDYDEFTVSQDEWGFVVFEVTAGENPGITVKRISRGNENNKKDNIITDSFTVYKKSKPVSKPIALSPNDESLLLECVDLKASDFSTGINNAQHGQSQWQVSQNSNFSTPVFESWKNFENWYENINTQINNDLTEEKVTGLNTNTKYWWRVRYRDKEFNWSEWSDPVSFNTSISAYSSNLLINPGAESGISGWNIEEGTLESLAVDECGSPAPHSGFRLFVAGGICTDYPVGRATQIVDVNQFSSMVDLGNFMAYFGAFMRDWDGSDIPQIKIYFYNSSNDLLGESDWLYQNTPFFTLKEGKIRIPVQTRVIKFEIKGVRNAGSDNDSYIDDIYLRVGQEVVDCNQVLTDDIEVNNIEIFPNPGKDLITIQTSDEIKSVQIFNIDGAMTKQNININKQNFTIDIENLKPGFYILKIEFGNGLINNKKLIKQ